MQSKNRVVASLAILVGIVYQVAVAAPPAAEPVIGSGTVTSETRTVRDFHGIDVSGAGEVTIVQGNRESLTVEAESNLLPFLESRVENGVLHLGARQAKLTTHQPIVYRVTLRTLDTLRASQASRVKMATLDTGHLDADVSGAGDLTIERLRTKVLNLKLSGASTARIAGSADSQRIAATGAGNYDGAKFVTQRADVSLAGASHADVYASVALKVEASGASEARYRGKPRSTIQSTDAASVEAVN